jgi:hypothetical protein
VGDDYLTPNGLIVNAAPFASDQPAAGTTRANPVLNDPAYIYQPFLFHARTAIRAGRLPVWNPYVATGRPLGAEQASPLHPVSLLTYLFPFADSFLIIALGKLMLAAAGTFLLCRRLKLTTSASTVGALAFAFGNPFFVFLGQPHSDVYALLPWAVLCLHQLTASWRLAHGLLLGFVGGVMLYGGHPESAFVAYATVAAYGAFRLAGLRRAGVARPSRKRIVGLLGAVSLSAAAVGALWILPFVESLGQASNLSRGGGGGDSLKQLGLGFIFPELWGRPDKHVFSKESFATLSSLYVGRPYAGAIPLMMAAAGLVLRRRPVQLFFAGAALTCGVIAVDNPVRDALSHIPPFSLMRLHNFVWPLAFALALLAAYGVDHIRHASRAANKRLALLVVVVAAVPVVGWLASHPGLVDSIGSAVQQLPTLREQTTSGDVAALGAVLRFALLVAVGVVAFVAVGRRHPRLFGGVLVALTLADVVTLGRGFYPSLPHRLADPPAPQSVGVIARAGFNYRMAGRGATFLPNLSARYEVLDTRAQDLPDLKRYDALFRALGGTSEPAFGETLVPRQTPARSRLLSLFGVRFLLDDAGGAPDDRGARTLLSRPGERLLDNTDSLPRAFMAYRWRPAATFDQALREAARADPSRSRHEPVIEGESGSGGASRAVDPAWIHASADTSVSIRADARSDGYLVLSDAFYPGWTAEVDGKKTAIHAANVAFRAVHVSKGTHEVTFSYRPRSVFIGALITLLGLFVIAVLVAGGEIRDRCRARGDVLFYRSGNARRERGTAQ